MKTISYSVQITEDVYADFTVEVIELDGPDYDFDVNDIQLIHVDIEGSETVLDMSTLSHDEQAIIMRDTNEAIDDFLSDNADNLLAKHADPNFLALLDGAQPGYLH
jgi:hypothetical protein